jgi:NAD(P)-dependent dehydrogenase (short-subunit alcohol dehydrogenase family)
VNIEGMGMILTGAATGLGATAARSLAARGARLALFDVNEPALRDVAAASQAIAIACDVSDAKAVERGVAQAAERLGELRGLVNVAGIAAHPRLLPRDGGLHSGEQFERLIAVNLTGTFHCCRFVAHHMARLAPQENGARGVIVNTASISAYESPVGGVAYAASKAGVIGMTLPMARELGEYGIRVMTVAPGPFMTPLFATFRPEQKQRFAENMSFPKEPADPARFAELVAHIIENDFLNAETIRIDGGTRLPRKY